MIRTTHRAKALATLGISVLLVMLIATQSSNWEGPSSLHMQQGSIKYYAVKSLTSASRYNPTASASQAFPPLKRCLASSPNYASDRMGCICREGEESVLGNDLQLRGNLTTMLAGDVNRLSIQFLSKDGAGYPILLDVDKGLPAIIITVEALDLSERLHLTPSYMSQGLYEFDFKLLTTNTFQVTIWLEGKEIRWPVANDIEFMRKNRQDLPLVKLMHYNISVIENPAIPTPLYDTYKALPRCNRNYVHDLAGRWIHPSLLPNDIRDHNIPSPFSEGRGSEMVFLPHTCRINYYSDKEAMSCLDKKRILIIGDSTSNEIAVDMAMHLFLKSDDHWPRYFTRESDDWNVDNVVHPSGDVGAVGCDRWMIQRQFYWPVAVDGKNTTVTKFWSPQPNPCKNGGGSSSVKDPKYLDRIQRALFDPEQILNFTYAGDPDATKKAPLPSLSDTIAKGSPTDFVVYNTLLHDILGPMTATYADEMDEILKGIKPGARIPMYMLSNAKVGYANVVVRYFNNIMREKVAPENGFIVYDAFNIQVGRLSGLRDKPIHGDHHHGTSWKESKHMWERTPFTHVPVQVLLNVFCE
ncbi:hypothetical protein BDR26DRAFT_860390 [Obelidium mucronatum]|nr:hypothetical protein BDR26DRAFT_860390 [Obelidium mucronatum]